MRPACDATASSSSCRSSNGRSVFSIVRGPLTATSASSSWVACASRASIAFSNTAADVMPVQNGSLEAPVAGADCAWTCEAEQTSISSAAAGSTRIGFMRFLCPRL